MMIAATKTKLGNCRPCHCCHHRPGVECLWKKKKEIKWWREIWYGRVNQTGLCKHVRLPIDRNVRCVSKHQDDESSVWMMMHIIIIIWSWCVMMMMTMMMMMNSKKVWRLWTVYGTYIGSWQQSGPGKQLKYQELTCWRLHHPNWYSGYNERNSRSLSM
jgi:hypothetical protein